MAAHPVLQRLLERSGKSGQPQDGRKMVLVLFGGIMVAARGGGALAAFEELGLTSAFDEIYTMSSGFANACYFLSGQMKQGVSMYYNELSGFKFLNVLRPWKLANLDYLIDLVRRIKPLDLKKLFDSRTKLYTMVTKLPEVDKGIFLEIHDIDPAHYFDLLRACSSLPIVAKGSVELNGGAYRDVFYKEALKDFIERVMAAEATDVVIVYNYDWQRSYVRSVADLDQEHVHEFAPDFYAGKKEWFQKMTRFETRSKVLKAQVQKFADQVKRQFGAESSVSLP